MNTIKKQLRRAFTIVELVIVIAVIAALAAILIPTFVNVVNSANNSSDEQAVKNMNTALQIYEVENDNKPVALCTVWEIIEEAGYNSQPTPNYSDNEFYWYKTDNRVLIYSISEAQIVFPAEYAGVTLTADGNTSNYKTVSAKYKASTSVENGVIKSADVLSLNIDKTDSDAHDSIAETTGRCSCCGDTVAVKVDSSTIDDRLETVEELGSIMLTSDIDMSQLTVDFKTVSIDLNGYTISTSGLYIVYDTEGSESRPDKDVEVVIENGTIKQSGDVDEDFGLIYVSYGAVTLKNVEIIADSGDIAVWNENYEEDTESLLTISNCNITGMIYTYPDSNTIIDGGTYTANSGDLYIIKNEGELIVKAGTFYVSDLPSGTSTISYKLATNTGAKESTSYTDYTTSYQFAIAAVGNSCSIYNSVKIIYSGDDGTKEMNTESGYVYVLYVSKNVKICILDSTEATVYNIKGQQSNKYFS